MARLGAAVRRLAADATATGGGFPALVAAAGRRLFRFANASFKPFRCSCRCTADEGCEVSPRQCAPPSSVGITARPGQFVGGTIDTRRADKEAATLSLEAYLLLFENTGERKWLDRAASPQTSLKRGFTSGMSRYRDATTPTALEAGVPTTGLQ